ncbi:hypothetical protein EGI22_21805 [Lacihabitans sp. LS3-19]|nr:hypothetical protein [Lacihabitans sp. LS3-19]
MANYAFLGTKNEQSRIINKTTIIHFVKIVVSQATIFFTPKLLCLMFVPPMFVSSQTFHRHQTSHCRQCLCPHQTLATSQPKSPLNQIERQGRIPIMRPAKAPGYPLQVLAATPAVGFSLLSLAENKTEIIIKKASKTQNRQQQKSLKTINNPH